MNSVLTTPTFVEYGPLGGGSPPSLAQAEAYCRDLTRRHYENFTVASWLLPKHLRQPFANIYAYCRWADDLADEAADPQQSLQLLQWWQQQLEVCYQGGEARHPVFRALAETIARFDIPQQPLADLLSAFRQDQHCTRYETFEDLADYCRYSANPVGRLVLLLGRCHNEDTAALSDCICTGLQLANHWQDLARDRRRGRIYFPQETLQQFGCSEADLSQGAASPALKRAVAHEVARARTYFEQRRELIALVSADIRLEVELFAAGGLAVLQAIERLDYDVLRRRPVIGKWHKLRLFAAAWMRQRGANP